MSLDDSGKPLLLNRVSQFLSFGVTQFVCFRGFSEITVGDAIKSSCFNYLKNKVNIDFLRGAQGMASVLHH
jgi:hypothetical protein